MKEKSEYRENPIINKPTNAEVTPVEPTVIKITPDMVTVLEKPLENVDPQKVQSLIDYLNKLEDLGYRED